VKRSYLGKSSYVSIVFTTDRGSVQCDKLHEAFKDSSGGAFMLRSEAELMVRRVAEETGVEFSDEQVAALAMIVLKIAGRMIEEAFATGQTNKPGGKQQFFT
jgi:hypothetical protein